MIKQYSGKLLRVVQKITSYEAVERPSIEINVEKPYKVIAHGESGGVDTFKVSAQGKIVKKTAASRILSFFDIRKAGIDARNKTQKQGGITYVEVGEINSAISKYNSNVELFLQVDGGQIFQEESRAEVELDKADKSELEEIVGNSD